MRLMRSYASGCDQRKPTYSFMLPPGLPFGRASAARANSPTTTLVACSWAS